MSGLISPFRIRNEAAVGVQGTSKRKGKKESQVVQLQIAHGLNQTYRMMLLCQLRFLQLQFKGLAQQKLCSIEVRSALGHQSKDGDVDESGRGA